MPNPHTLISAYPYRIIDDIVDESNSPELYVYIDLKNVLTAIFIENVVNEIVLNSQTMTNVDSSIFQSVLCSISSWKSYAANKGLKIKIFISTDIGRTVYHRNIYKGYKKSRDIVNTSSPVNGRVIKGIRDKNFTVAELICNRIPNVYFFCLKYLESDFVPYYLITRKFCDKDVLHIICSNDKDLFQILNLPNTIQSYKIKNVNTVLTRRSMLRKYTKLNKMSVKTQASKLEKLSRIDPNYIAAMMAVQGDSGDDVPGIKGVAGATLIDLFSRTDIVNDLIGTPKELDDRISSGGKIFREDQIGIGSLPKQWKNVFLNNDLITMSYKLISFESLCRWLEIKNTTEKIDYINYMDKILYKDGINIVPSSDSFCLSLANIEDLYLNKETIQEMFIDQIKQVGRIEDVEF